jgi:hypothetical protein
MSVIKRVKLGGVTRLCTVCGKTVEGEAIKHRLPDGVVYYHTECWKGKSDNK